MKAILLERNPLVRRHIERYLRCSGYDPVSLEDSAQVDQHLENASLLAADTFDAETVVRAIGAKPGIDTVLWTAEPMERALRFVKDAPGLSNIVGRRNFDSPPRDWELMMILRRLSHPLEEGPKFAWFLNWGFSGFHEKVDTTATRDRLVTKVQDFVTRITGRKKIAPLFGEVAHELLMNAMYDAPVDAQGRHKYAADRKAELRLPANEQPTLKIASDGTKLVIEVTDPFGGLERDKVFGSIARGLNSGLLDTTHGGAGLGLTLIQRGTSLLFIDVIRGKQTAVTGIFEIDATHRDFRLQPKSLHYFSRESSG